MRFPRGGVGLVIGASFFVFAVYYVALTGGESLANRNFITPFWAMWADNIIFLVVGVVLIARMGTERVTSRGGGMGERMDGVRMWFARAGTSSRRAARARRHEHMIRRLVRPLDRYVFGEFWKIFIVTATRVSGSPRSSSTSRRSSSSISTGRSRCATSR